MGFWSSLVSTLLGVGASLVAWYIIKSIKPRICISEQIEKPSLLPQIKGMPYIEYTSKTSAKHIRCMTLSYKDAL